MFITVSPDEWQNTELPGNTYDPRINSNNVNVT